MILATIVARKCEQSTGLLDCMVPSVQMNIDRDERVRDTTGMRRAERGGDVLAHAWGGAVPRVR